MVLGFGFNKTKVLSAAEKFIQQGKLQNAIVEYEKITKEDPKDLTVLNTIGDLYSRIGQADQAVACFRKVGDAYASQGFTVKAIAMYKKLTKLSPSAIECTQKLAELYTVQGLLNDARSQYVQVAESHLRNDNPAGAAQIFQKMLELDPENAAMQTKLASLYVKLGKNDEAKNIYFRAAESLHSRNVLPAADEALAKVLELDAQNGRALEMRAQIALQSGNTPAAISYFELLPDIDSRADALRSLLKAYLQSKRGIEAEAIARKLLNVHHEISGITAFGDHLLATGQVSDALRFYQEFEDRLLAADSEKFTQAIYNCVSRVKDDVSALETIRGIFLKAGDTTHNAEIIELLAHASVQTGNLERARELYKELMEWEPENPLHSQNYKQIVVKLGIDPTIRQLSAEEGGQAFMVDELEPVTAVVSQEYPEELSRTIQNALTDSELFDSYNVPGKAIPPLEAVLHHAPKDIRINQRLASLYARTGRLAEASACCCVLEEVYRIGGFSDEATQYREMAERYAEKAGIAVPPIAPTPEPEAPIQKTAAHDDFGSFDLPVMQDKVAAAPAPTLSAPAVAPEPVVEPQSVAHEFDLSDEWESIAASPASATPAPFAPEAQAPATQIFEWPAEDLAAAPTESAPESPVRDLEDETSFYIAQSMWSEAQAALDKLASIAPDHPSLAAFRQQITDSSSSLRVSEPSVETVETVEPVPEPSQGDSTIAEFVFDTGMLGIPAEPAPAHAVDESPTAEPAALPDIFEHAPAEPPVLDIPELPVEEPPALEVAPEPTASAPATEELSVDLAPEIEHEPFDAPAADSPLASDVAFEVPPAPPKHEPESISDFALDLENSLGDDFAIAPPAPPEVRPPTIPPAPAPTPVEPIAASAASVELPVSPETIEETNTVLADMFAEFKEDVEDSSQAEDDPDTHYNLGVAFKEMGLLDEAIGELQKVAQSVDRGAPFSQTMQAYTWLALCFVEKGVPEASFRWYDKALKLAKDDDTRTAIHYDLGCAHEIAGDKRQALTHFTEVYGSNIDYRDVAERIKALKS